MSSNKTIDVAAAITANPTMSDHVVDKPAKATIAPNAAPTPKRGRTSKAGAGIRITVLTA